MSIAYDAVASIGVNNDVQTNTGRIYFNHVLGAASGNNRIVIIQTGTESGGNVTGVTYNGVACTFLVRANRAHNICELWYILDSSLPSAAGTYEVSIQFTNSGDGIHQMGGCTSFTGVEQNAPEVTSTNNAATYTLTTSLTTATGDSWIVDVCNGSDAGSFTASGTSQTERWDQQAGSTTTTACSTRGPITSTGSYSFTWTHSDNTMSRICACMCSIAPFGGASSSSSSRSSSSSSSRSSSSSSCSSSSSSSSRSSSSSSSSSINSSSSSCRSSSSSSCSSSSSSCRSSSSSCSSSSSGSFGASGGRQIIHNCNNYGIFGGTRYGKIMASVSSDSTVSAWAPNDDEHQEVMPTAGSFRRLVITSDQAPGTGNTYTLTVMRNGSATALSATITGNTLSGSNLTDIASFNAGDIITIRAVPTGSPPQAPRFRWGIEFNSVAFDESIILGGLHTEVSRNNATQYSSLIGGDTWDTVEVNKVFVVPKAGVLKKLTGLFIDGNTKLPAGPGTGNTKTFTVMKNGVATALSVGLTGSTSVATDSTNVIQVVPGDLISLQLVHSGPGSGNREARWGCVFVPDVVGEFIVPHQGFAPSTTQTSYMSICGSDATWNTSTADRLMGSYATSFKRMYVKLENAPGNGKSYRFVLRNETQGVDTALDVTISDLNTSALIDTNVSVNSGDNLVYKCIPSGGPTAGRAQIGLTGFFVATSSSSSSCSSSSSSRSSSSSSRSSSSSCSSSSSSSSRCSSSSCSSSCRSSSSCSSSSSSRSSSSSSSSSSSKSSSSSSSGILLSSSSSRSSSSSSSSSARTQDTNSGWTDRTEFTISG